ncbi:hypothetical protein [Chryseobacterium sp. FH2]|uniref:hypothetical protein n=1 Tax=Chryseobacterium sp. FH2 TaxID=1674291 RepID=UPI001040BA1A|nr:hypothetical protein [Chryseobacterium sp. FH2]
MGRFIAIAPLSEKFRYNSTYAFQENKLGMGREFEGLELVPFEFLMMSNSSVEPVIPIAEQIREAPIEGIWNGAKDFVSDIEFFSKNTPKETSTPKTMDNTVENIKPENITEQVSKTGEGRGSNNRTDDDEAIGDHTVRNEKGSTTYKENPNNPNKNSQGKGFETVKRVDYEGTAHKNKSGETVPTPHVHEGTGKNSTIKPAIPGKDMPINL